jgi:hypothetical protein
MSLGQTFAYQYNDSVLGFRKTGNFQANYELVVDIGPVTNYTTLAAGATVTVPSFSPLQLSDAFPNTNLDNLNWSVSAGDSVVSVLGYPGKTIWLTVQRTNANVQSAAPLRLNRSSLQVVGTEIVSILDGAVTISATIGASNQDNTASLVREPINNDSNLSAFMASQQDSTASTLRDSWTANVEIATPGAFKNPVRSDFYEVRPFGALDPHTGLTNGPAYYVGYFEFKPDGSMTFNRVSTNSLPPPLPPVPVLSLNRSGMTTIITVGTTNGATYRLLYTNSAGLSAPASRWQVSSTVITGDGTTKTFTDNAPDPDRVYRVNAH